MKNLLARPLGLLTLALAFSLGLLPRPASAQQQLSIKGVPEPPQLLPIEGKGYVALYRSEAGEDGRDLYAMRILGTDLKVKHQYVLPIPVGAAPLATLPGKANYTLAFHSQGQALLSLYAFNPLTGAQVSRDLTAQPAGRRMPAGTPLVAGTPTDGYCLVQPYRNDTTGYVITVLDAAMKTEWSRMYFPRDLRQHVPLRVAVSKDVITLVLSDSYILFPNTRQQRYLTDFAVLGIDRASGKVLYRTPTRRAGLTMLPSHLLPLSDGRLVSAGLYFNSISTRVDSLQGIFMTTYKPDGTASAPVLTPWAELAKTLNDPELGARIQQRKAYLPLLELLTTTGTDARLVAEYNEGRPGPFVVLTYNAAGLLSGSHLVARTYKAGTTPDEQRYSRYRSVIGKQGEPYLIYTGVEGNQEYAYSTVLASVPSRTAARAAAGLDRLPSAPSAPVATDPVSQKLDQFRRNLSTAAEVVNKYVYGDTLPPVSQVYFRPDPLTGFVAGTPGQVMLYRYEPGPKLLRLELQPMQ